MISEEKVSALRVYLYHLRELERVLHHIFLHEKAIRVIKIFISLPS